MTLEIPSNHASAEAECVFCRILRGLAPAAMVLESGGVAVFATHQPYNPGHVLVVPRRHIATIYDLPDELVAAVFQTAARVARAMKVAFAADGTTIRQHNERAGGQEVAHIHVHVIPRIMGDDERLRRIPPVVGLEEQRYAATMLREALARE